MKVSKSRYRVPEAALVARAADLLRSEGALVCFEVPSLGQSVDLVAEKNDKYIAIEAKVSDWRRALRQATPHLLVADYVAIAVSYNEIPRSLIDEAVVLGIGIINWRTRTDAIEWVLEARESRRVWGPQKNVFRKNVMEVGYAS